MGLDRYRVMEVFVNTNRNASWDLGGKVHQERRMVNDMRGRLGELLAKAIDQRALSRKVIDYLSRRLATYKRREFVDARFRDLMNRSEVTQQAGLPLFTHAGNCRKLRGEVAQLAALAMVGHRVTMRLVANHLNQTQHR